ncbi:hypothetical protein ACRALDRAFT_1073188 [Sodiomyces alcalophilus JCM 7366]|uniref:uncharacterized protein n=1 Tax=Sodiomyces alcalophilus JCM 7366 TaxID=591952 RepID=UPI0039B4A093
MTSTFRPVNTRPAADPKSEDATATIPNTPRSSASSLSQDPQTFPTDDSTTPTRASFAGSALAAQKPLPSSPFPDAVHADKSAKPATGETSRYIRKAESVAGGDAEDSDGETAPGDEGVASEGESANGDGSKSGKKKKSQRFYCTDYPPCNLSFTRSEHLARHIRKHTGERPFQCHCSRRFSRLDNLRQHAQTVHVNEDIPIDSLAATGARFQRQIRTDRVRQIGGRARPSTAGAGNGVRGHSKSLSTSSVGSVSSVGSFASPRDDLRRRPPPLVMADPRGRPGLEGGYHRPAEGSYVFRPVTPTDYSTPTSATFSTGQGSPRWGSAIVSPTTSHSRSQSMYSVEPRTPGRRLSVPSTGGNPFQSPHGPPMNRSVFGPGAMNSSNSGAFSPATSSILGSPTTPLSAWSGRRDSSASVADDVWKRRTWHPESRGLHPNTGTYPGNAASAVTAAQYQPPPPQLPTANASNSPQTIRLPGIESFDPLPPRPTSPPRRNPSPMMIDSEPTNPPTLLPSTDPAADDRLNAPHWDMGLRRGLTRLDLRSNNAGPPRDSASNWATEADQAVQAQAERARANQPTVRFELDQHPAHSNSNRDHGSFSRGHQYTMSAPHISTPRDAKRHGWYHGPISGPPQPSAEPGQDGRGPHGSHVDRIVHPNMTAFTGFPARDARREPQPPGQQQNSNSQHGGGDRPPNAGSSRFDALVAVAASEGSTAAAY